MNIQEIIAELASYIEKQDARIAELEGDIAKWKSEETGFGKLEQMPDVLTVDEIAKVMRSSVGSVYRIINEGKLKSFRAGASGKAYRCWKEDVIEYIENAKVTAPKERTTATGIPLKIIEKGKPRRKSAQNERRKEDEKIV